MKIAITALGESPDSPVDQRFGRARFFLLYDLDTGRWTVHANTQNLQAAQGAGIQAAQRVADLGATAVITGHCGPKAFATLAAAAGIAVYQAGTLKPSPQATVASGFGSV